MRVHFDKEVLARPREYGREVSAIVDRCDRGQHQWVIDTLEDVLESSWMLGRASWDPLDEVAKKAYRTSVDDDPSARRQRTLTVVPDGCSTTGGTDTARFEVPARAREILEEALYLVLENGTADWYFVCAMSKCHQQLEAAVSERWIRPDHAGGKSECIKRFEHLVNERRIAPWRIAALIDSDRLAAGPLPAENDNIRRNLETRGAKVFVLFKREVENYLPPSLLIGEDEHRKASFQALGREQQDYFDMKKGFRRRVGDCFQNATVDRVAMDHVCSTCPGEIEGILQALEEML